LPDGTPVIISSGVDGTVWVWRLADGSPIGEPPDPNQYRLLPFTATPSSPRTEPTLPFTSQ
jgi:hypothetical protein